MSLLYELFYLNGSISDQLCFFPIQFVMLNQGLVYFIFYFL